MDRAALLFQSGGLSVDRGTRSSNPWQGHTHAYAEGTLVVPMVSPGDGAGGPRVLGSGGLGAGASSRREFGYRHGELLSDLDGDVGGSLCLVVAGQRDHG